MGKLFSMAEFQGFDECPTNKAWSAYLSGKNKELKKLNKCQIIEKSSDVFPTSDQIADITAVFVTNQKPSYILSNKIQVFNLPERSWYGGYYTADSQNYRDISVVKKYTCLNNRLDVHRQAFFYELFRANLLDDACVSMLCEIRNRPGADLKQVWTQMHKDYNRCFDEYLSQVLEILPFRNFDASTDIREILTSTAYNVVFETAVNRPDCISFTEKTMRSLQLPRPFLLMCSSGSVQNLRHLGFDMFDKFVDHSYDSLDTSTNAMPRLIAIFSELQRLCKEMLNKNMISEWQKICQHNTEVLRSMNQQFDENFAVVDQAFDYIISST